MSTKVRRGRGIWIWLAAAVAAIAACAWWLRPAPVAVEVATVTRGAFERTVDEQARTRVANHYTVSAPLAGVVGRIALLEGDRVERGQPVAVLRPLEPTLLDARSRAELQARVESATAAAARARSIVAAATVALEQARTTLARTEKLAAQHLVPDSALDDERLLCDLRARELDASRDAAHAAAHDVELARAALGRSGPGASGAGEWLLQAPVGGHVVRVHQKSEAAVAVGAPLVEIANLDEVEVLVEMLTTEAAQVDAGAPVVLTGWGGPPLAGRVRRVEPLAFTKISVLGVEEQRVNVIVDLLTPVAQRPRLGEGFRLDAHVRVYARDDVLRVPVGALFTQGDAWAVYVAGRDGRAALRPVRLGQRGAADAEVIDGLAAGERVVVYPSDTLTPGARIAIEPR